MMTVERVCDAAAGSSILILIPSK